jgi:hypothetical protein
LRLQHDIYAASSVIISTGVQHADTRMLTSSPRVCCLGFAAPAGPLRLQVTGFKQGLGEAEIQQIFEPFGPVESVTVVRDGAGQPINIAYVIFQNKTDGQNAQVG